MRVTDPSQISQSDGYCTWNVQGTEVTIDFVTLSATDVQSAINQVGTGVSNHYQRFLPSLSGSDANTQTLTNAFRDAAKEILHEGASSAPAGNLTFGITSKLEGNTIKLYWTYGKDQGTVVANLHDAIKDGKADKEIALTYATYNSEEEGEPGLRLAV